MASGERPSAEAAAAAAAPKGKAVATGAGTVDVLWSQHRERAELNERPVTANSSSLVPNCIPTAARAPPRRRQRQSRWQTETRCHGTVTSAGGKHRPAFTEHLLRAGHRAPCCVHIPQGSHAVPA